MVVENFIVVVPTPYVDKEGLSTSPKLLSCRNNSCDLSQSGGEIAFGKGGINGRAVPNGLDKTLAGIDGAD